MGKALSGELSCAGTGLVNGGMFSCFSINLRPLTRYLYKIKLTANLGEYTDR